MPEMTEEKILKLSQRQWGAAIIEDIKRLPKCEHIEPEHILELIKKVAKRMDVEEY